MWLWRFYDKMIKHSLQNILFIFNKIETIKRVEGAFIPVHIIAQENREANLFIYLLTQLFFFGFGKIHQID